jgi:hypothetical protein
VVWPLLRHIEYFCSRHVTILLDSLSVAGKMDTMGSPTAAPGGERRRMSVALRRLACVVGFGALVWPLAAGAEEAPPAEPEPPEAPATSAAPPSSSSQPESPGESPYAKPAPTPPGSGVAPSQVSSHEAPTSPPSPAESEESESPAIESPVEVHGFVSQGLIKTSANNYLANSERGSLEFTEVGLNFTKQITDDFRVGAQLFTRDLGPIGNYSAQLDWFYFDYRFFDWLGLRAGRTKLPFGLYNETSDIDAARVPILLPQSVYPITSRDFLLAQTGAELYGLVPLGGAGDLDYRLYGGTLFFDLQYEGAGDSVKKIDTPYIVGGRLMWRPPLSGLTLGGSVQKLRLDFDYVLPDAQLAGLRAAGRVPANFSGLVSARIPALLAVGSIEYAPGDLAIAAEYARWRTEIQSSMPEALPETTKWSERFYVMASYRLNPWFVPGAYYSALFPNVDDRAGRKNHEHDFAASLRFDVNPHWLWKVEGHFMRGTAGLSSQLNDNAPLDTLTRDWLVFLVKTTAYF